MSNKTGGLLFQGRPQKSGETHQAEAQEDHGGQFTYEKWFWRV